MGKRYIKAWKILVTILFSSLFISACGSDEDSYSTFENQIINIVLENSEVNVVISEEDIVIDQIYCGTFSQEGTNEMLVTCKILNMPHVGGMDRTAIILLNVDTMEMVTYREFGADRVDISCLKTSSGYDRILILATSTNTGLVGHDILLFSLQGSQWTEMSMDVLKKIQLESRGNIGSEYFGFASEERLIVSYEYDLMNPEEIITILRWDPDMEQFVMDDQTQ